MCTLTCSTTFPLTILKSYLISDPVEKNRKKFENYEFYIISCVRTIVFLKGAWPPETAACYAIQRLYITYLYQTSSLLVTKRKPIFLFEDFHCSDSPVLILIYNVLYRYSINSIYSYVLLPISSTSYPAGLNIAMHDSLNRSFVQGFLSFSSVGEYCNIQPMARCKIRNYCKQSWTAKSHTWLVFNLVMFMLLMCVRTY